MENTFEKSSERKDLENLTTITRRERLYHSLANDRVHRWQTTLFDVFVRLESVDGKRKRNKFQILINYLALIIRKLQLLSLVLLDYNLEVSFTLMSLFNTLMVGTRLDVLSIKLDFEIEYLMALIASVYIWGVCFVLLYIQIYFKKRIFLKPIILSAQILGWLCEYIIFIPYIYTALIYIKYSWDQNHKVEEYGSKVSDNLSPLTALILIFGAIILQFILYFRTIYNCNPAYSLKNKRHRMYSLISLKDFFLQEVVTFCAFTNSVYYFEATCIISSLYMAWQYIAYLPFVTLFDNGFEASTWIMLIFGEISHIIAYHVGALHAKVLLMVFVFPAAMVLFYSLMRWRFDRIKNWSKDDPFTVELKIRKILLGIKLQDFTDELLEIIKKTYTEATKKFLSFKLMFIWESIFTLNYRNNKSLALLKLSKINFSCTEHLKIWYQSDKQVSSFYSFPDLEAEFLFYFLYKKLVNEERSEDLILLRYLKDMNEFKNKDLEVSSELWNVYRKISNISRHPARAINRACTKLIEVKHSFEIFAERMIKKYQADSELLSIYGSYMTDFLEQSEGNLFLARSRVLKESNDGGIEKLTGFKYQKGTSIMVVSGMFGSIGDILYLNNDILDLLKIECIDNVIGTSFCQFMPAPFDVMHYDILRRYLIFGDKVDLYRPHMFLITAENHCVEVSMHFRLVFYKQIPYFIADFNSRGHRKNLILHSPDGLIYAVSKDIKNFIGSREGTVFEVILNLAYYYEQYDTGQCFEYNEDFYCKMMRFKLAIDGFVLEVLYMADSLEAISPTSDTPPLFIKKRAGSFNEFAYRTDISMEPDEAWKKTTDVASNHTYASSILSKISIKRKTEVANLKIFTLCRALNMNIRIAIGVLFVVTFISIILETVLVNNLKMSDILNDLDYMRYLENSILLNIRSLDLISQGYKTAFTESYYRDLLQKTSESLEDRIILNNDKIHSYGFLHNIFSDNKASISELIEGNSVRVTYENLFHCAQAYVTHAKAIINTDISDFKTIYNDFYFIYYNLPTEMIRMLNESVYTISKDFEDHVDSTFLFLKFFKAAFFVPPIIMIILSIPTLIILEKINKENWHNLSHLDMDRQTYLRDKLIDRLRDLHGISVDFIEPKASTNENYSSIWKILIIKILLLQILSIAYYIAALYGFQIELNEILIYQSKFIFNHGLRRMLSENSYFWAREKFVGEFNNSFMNWIDKSPFPSFSVKLDFVINELEYLEKLLSDKDYSEFYSSNMVNLEVGNPCDAIEENLASCESSYVGVGINPAMKSYVNELKDYSVSSHSSWEDIVRLEKYSDVLARSTVFMTYNYLNSTDDKIDEKITGLMVATLLYFFSLIIVSIILVFHAVNKIKNELIGKIDILKYF
ncbi:unnamed protein product [Blepharisma stoltei]|uniref:Uncharacterized protein n=1 Tax=Blepharisma stoltei TaxID=1481888 RepID=A0AAU9KD22_9CILI|nr:unnamed protein product [Blepharisma stoltei]